MSRRGGIALGAAAPVAVALAAVALAACAVLGCAAVGGTAGGGTGGAAGAGGAGGAGRAGDAGGGGHGLASVPASAPELLNPFGESPAAVAAGRKLFLRHCAECHGDDGRGSRRGPSLDSRRLRQASPGALFWFLTNGRLAAGMPGWSRLPAARRWQIVAYLRGKDSGSLPSDLRSGDSGVTGGLPDERGVYSLTHGPRDESPVRRGPEVRPSRGERSP
jgi:mono/diheme cytochrome c family protein